MLIFIAKYAFIGAFMKIDGKVKHLQSNFTRLSEMNQQYVLGLAVGLKHVQESSNKLPRQDNVSLGKNKRKT